MDRVHVDASRLVIHDSVTASAVKTCQERAELRRVAMGGEVSDGDSHENRRRPETDDPVHARAQSLQADRSDFCGR